MTENPLAAIADGLRQEGTRLGGVIEKLQAALAAAQSERERTMKALAVLEGKPARKPKGTKSSVTSAEVADIIAAVLSERGPMELETLKGEVSTRVAAAGKSRQGLALAIKAALKDTTRFVETPGGYRLTSDAAGQVETVAAESDT